MMVVLVVLGGVGGVDSPARTAGVGLVAAWRRAGQSLRLRLRSGLRQSGRAFDPVG
ncbi:MAG: hypothetical protein HIU91_16580 [Acidobacteria bacterium]|nr:hypothetical protein [Acidobacteriota bacterium]